MSILTDIRSASLTTNEIRIVRHHLGRAMTEADPRGALLVSLGREERWGFCEDAEPAATARVKLATLWTHHFSA